MKIGVLGAGLVGGVIARDLAERKIGEVIAVDASEKRLEEIAEGSTLRVKVADLRQQDEREKILISADFILNAVPGWLGFTVLEHLVSLGKPAVDIAFSPEDPRPLSAKAKAPIVVDAGVAPGLSNLLLGKYAAQAKELAEAVIYVGGLPRERYSPWEYRAPFSPADVIEEYTRPARIVRHGKVVTLEPLTLREEFQAPGVGTLEAFATDGLRTLLDGVKARNMVEKTLRYPGHIDLIVALKKSGFFDEKTFTSIHGEFVPRQVTEAMLFESWQMGPEDEDLTVMRVLAREPINEGTERLYRADLYDCYDADRAISSMARTTGYTAIAFLEEIIAGNISSPGVFAPESFGKDASLVSSVLEKLQKRGITLREEVTTVTKKGTV